MAVTSIYARMKLTAIQGNKNVQQIVKINKAVPLQAWSGPEGFRKLTLNLRRSRTGTVWFYTSTSNKRGARPKLYTKSLTRDLKLVYSRLKLVRISINL